MGNVVREVNNELFEFVAKYVYETYQYLVSMEEVLEYVRLVMVELAEKKITVIEQGEVIDMVSKLIINDTKKLASDTEFEPSKKKINNNVVSDDRYSLVFKSAPVPYLTSSNILSAPIANFLLIILDAINAFDETVPVTSLNA